MSAKKSSRKHGKNPRLKKAKPASSAPPGFRTIYRDAKGRMARKGKKGAVQQYVKNAPPRTPPPRINGKFVSKQKFRRHQAALRGARTRALKLEGIDLVERRITREAKYSYHDYQLPDSSADTIWRVATAENEDGHGWWFCTVKVGDHTYQTSSFFRYADGFEEAEKCSMEIDDLIAKINGIYRKDDEDEDGQDSIEIFIHFTQPKQSYKPGGSK